MLTNRPPYRSSAYGSWNYNAGRKDSTAFEDAVHLFTRDLPETAIDRKRLDRLTEESVEFNWAGDIGSQQLIFSGRGGSGKTYNLLRTALHEYNREPRRRTLILTYNIALVTDIQRQLMLLGVGDDIAEGSIRVRGVHAFLRGILIVLGVGQLAGDFPDLEFGQRYITALEEYKVLRQADALTRHDIALALASHAAEFDWDLICIDEGQDWLDDERFVLHDIYGCEKFVVAIGNDQLIRQREECVWEWGVENRTRIRELNECLRMKRNLADFATRFAQVMNVGTWKVRPSTKLGGGQVKIIGGDFFNGDALDDVRAVLTRDNVRAVDALMMLPAHSAGAGIYTPERVMLELHKQGLRVWDGTNVNARRNIPWYTDQLRLVHYESARGLEGWVAVCLGLDLFFDALFTNWKPRGGSTVSAAFSLDYFDEDRAFLDAARWLIVPLTRAIDTLFINVVNPNSRIGTALKTIAADLPEVTWHDLTATRTAPAASGDTL
jgi:hypothetical protein